MICFAVTCEHSCGRHLQDVANAFVRPKVQRSPHPYDCHLHLSVRVSIERVGMQPEISKSSSNSVSQLALLTAH